nr:MAG TPA: hypothetical protein [Caudoviricetes sp.]
MSLLSILTFTHKCNNINVSPSILRFRVLCLVYYALV